MKIIEVEIPGDLLKTERRDGKTIVTVKQPRQVSLCGRALWARIGTAKTDKSQPSGDDIDWQDGKGFLQQARRLING